MHNRTIGPKLQPSLQNDIEVTDRYPQSFVHDNFCSHTPGSVRRLRTAIIHALSTKNATTTMYCSFRTHKRRKRRVRTIDSEFAVTRSTIILLAGAICIMFSRKLYLHFNNVNYPTTTNSSLKVQQGRVAPTTMSPFKSHPPKVGLLNGSSNIRHSCIAEIRNHRHTFFVPYIQNANHVLLVDPAYHSNVGDHMITVAELNLIQQEQYRTATSTATTKTLSQCSYVQAHDFVPSCEKVLKTEVENPNHIIQTYASSSSMTLIKREGTTPTLTPLHEKIALWHGGGNFGNLWSTAQQARIKSIILLLRANYTIIGMPNSWYYVGNNKELIEDNDVQQFRSNMILGLGLELSITDEQLANITKSRIIWTWREQYSYEHAQELLPYCTHHLVPDIAFQLGPYHQNQQLSATANGSTLTRRSNDPVPTPDLVFLLRNDHESIFSSLRNRQSIQNLLYSIPGAAHISFSIVDWDDRLVRFQDADSSNPNDIYFTDTSIQLLSMGRILICDRLHAAILAYISNLSFIYLDQISGKIRNTFAVAMESGPSCRYSSKMFDDMVQEHNDTKKYEYDDSLSMWSRAEKLSDAIEKAVKILDLQRKSSAAQLKLTLLSDDEKSQQSNQQQLLTREQRRNKIRLHKLVGG